MSQFLIWLYLPICVGCARQCHEQFCDGDGATYGILLIFWIVGFFVILAMPWFI